MWEADFKNTYSAEHLQTTAFIPSSPNAAKCGPEKTSDTFHAVLWTSQSKQL